MRLLPTLAVLSAVLAAPAHAAGSYDSCTAFITSLPAYIATQGTYCFNKDLSTPQASGEVILVDANNVTIDCNGFKLGGLSAGPETQAVGIATLGRLNTTIRDCNIRGFDVGIRASGGGGHTIEDNRVEGSQSRGISIENSGGVLRRNRVLDSAIGDHSGFIVGVHVSGSVDVIDNTIDGVAPSGPSAADAIGLHVDDNPDGAIDGNRIRGIAPTPGRQAFGIYTASVARLTIRGNQIVGTGLVGSYGIYCGNDLASAAQNQVAGFETGIAQCHGLTNNWVNPN